MRKNLILVIDDEPPMLRLVRVKLQLDGYAVVPVSSGAEALHVLKTEHPDLVVLDLMMPVMDGFETLRHIREISSVPVILLTARVNDIDKLRGLTSGADDYVTKPFNPDELSARIAAVLRRSTNVVEPGVGQVLRYPGIEIDLDRHRVMVDGEEVRLTRTEWELLAQLGANAGRVMTHAELLSRIWGPEYRDESHYLRTWVSRLRAKLEPNVDQSALISTFPGIGYRLESPNDSGR